MSYLMLRTVNKLMFFAKFNNNAVYANEFIKVNYNPKTNFYEPEITSDFTFNFSNVNNLISISITDNATGSLLPCVICCPITSCPFERMKCYPIMQYISNSVHKNQVDFIYAPIYAFTDTYTEYIDKYTGYSYSESEQKFLLPYNFRETIEFYSNKYSSTCFYFLQGGGGVNCKSIEGNCCYTWSQLKSFGFDVITIAGYNVTPRTQGTYMLIYKNKYIIIQRLVDSLDFTTHDKNRSPSCFMFYSMYTQDIFMTLLSMNCAGFGLYDTNAAYCGYSTSTTLNSYMHVPFMHKDESTGIYYYYIRTANTNGKPDSHELYNNDEFYFVPGSFITSNCIFMGILNPTQNNPRIVVSTSPLNVNNYGFYNNSIFQLKVFQNENDVIYLENLK